jgi:hypothetical protein
VAHYFSAGYYATAEVQLPDGRLITASLAENRAATGNDRQGFLSLSVQTPCTPFCAPSTASGTVDLTDEQVTFDRGLRTASVEDVTLTLTTPARTLPGTDMPPGGSVPPPPGGYVPPPGGFVPPTVPYLPPGDYVPPTVPYLPPGDYVPPPVPYLPPGGSVPPTGPYTPPVIIPAQSEEVTITLEFTGTGTVSRDAEHQYTDCSDTGMCQSTRLSAERAAHLVVTVDRTDGESETFETDQARLFYAQGVDAGGRLPKGIVE